MTAAANRARQAGALYLTVALLGGFAHLVARAAVYEAGDASTTAANVLAHSDVIRLGVVADLCQATIFAFLGLLLFRLFDDTHHEAAGLVAVLGLMASTIICVAVVFQFAGLMVRTEPQYETAFGVEGSAAMVLLLFDLQRYGYLAAQIFFGLWLLPLGFLVHRSMAFPRTLAALLLLGGACYVTGTAIEYLSPNVGEQVELIIYAPPTIAEFWLIGALLAGRGTATPSTQHATS